LSLELRPEVEKLIRERARAEGVSVDELPSGAFTGEQAYRSATPSNRVREITSDWQAHDRDSLHLIKSNLANRVPDHSLFAAWREQDFAMSEQEKLEEDRLWSELEPALVNGI
jgi:hypothetical protein